MVRQIRTYELGCLIFDPRAGMLSHGRKRERLTPLRKKLLVALCENPEDYLDQPALFRRAWELEQTREQCTGKVDNQVSALRTMAERLGEAQLIVNERGYGYRLDVTCIPHFDDEEHGHPSAPGSARLDARALMQESLSASAEPGTLLVIEAKHPLETRPEYRGALLQRLEAGMRTVIILGPDGGSTAALILQALLDEWMRKNEPPVEFIAGQGNLCRVLRHLWIVLAPRVGIVPAYVLRAQDPHLAKYYAYHVQNECAFLFYERELACAHAKEMCTIFPAGQHALCAEIDHPVVYYADGLPSKALSAKEFEQGFVSASRGTLWQGALPALLTTILPAARKTARKETVLQIRKIEGLDRA